MGIEQWSEDVILVNLPRRLQEHDELQSAIDMAHKRGDSDVVVDFSSVDIVGGTTLTWLLELRQLLQDRGHTLVLCSVAPATKGIFIVARLDEVFGFVEDRFAALAHFQTIG